MFQRLGEIGNCAFNLILVAVLLVVMACTTNAVTISILEESTERTVIHYEFSDFKQNAIKIKGRTFTEINLGDESLKKEQGAPELPDVSRSIIIPDDARMDVRVLDSSYYDIEKIDIVPSKGYILRTTNPADVPYTFGKAYETDVFYPGPLSTLRKPFIMRDYRGIVVTANPFQYNPIRHLLRVYTKLTVEVSAVSKGQVNVLKREGRKRALVRPFHDIYSSHFINYGTYGLEGKNFDPNIEDGEMLIIAHDPWISNLQPLVDHKNNIGIDTTVVGVSTIGNDPNSIKDYIQDVYDTNDLAFVLLVGDINEVISPRLYLSGKEPCELSDPIYSKLDGDDDYPDIIIGRFSAQTVADVNTQVERTIDYENMPATLQDWFWRGTGIGSASFTNDKTQIDHIRNDLLSYKYTTVDQIYEDTSNLKLDVTDGINAGRGVINYCGHGLMYCWPWIECSPKQKFSNDDVHALTNTGMLPFIFSVSCVIGDFDYEQNPWPGYPYYPECFAEAWMRATHYGEPTGAIGIYASAIIQSEDPPMCAQKEFIDLLVRGSYRSYGALCFAGSCKMIEQHPPPPSSGSGVEMFNHWHIFGDPSLRVVGTVKAVPPVAHDGSTGIQSDKPARFALRVLDDGEPDPPGEPNCIIASLPGHGTLSDPVSGNISSVPYTLVDNTNQVIFTPDTGYTGRDSFTFKAYDGGSDPNGGYSNESTINMSVFEDVDIAPAGLWRLDEGSGNTAYDASGNDYDGQIQKPAWTSLGPDNMGWCQHFNNEEDKQNYISISPISALAGSNVTISAWIKPGLYCYLYDFFYYPIFTQCYYEDGDENDYYYGYWLGLFGDMPRFHLNSEVNPAPFSLSLDTGVSSGAIDMFQWHHVTGTYDDANLKIYVDGVLEDTQALADEIGVSNNAYIGRPVSSFETELYFDGEIDDVRVYNQALSLAQVWEIMFNDTSKFSVKDSSGDKVAWFDSLGNLFLTGTLDQESSHSAGINDEFRIQDSGSSDIAIIDLTNGNMYIDGVLNENQDMSQLTPENFIIKNSDGDAVAYISEDGNLYLKGELFED